MSFGLGLGVGFSAAVVALRGTSLQPAGGFGRNNETMAGAALFFRGDPLAAASTTI